MKKLNITYKKDPKASESRRRKASIVPERIAEYEKFGLDICYLDESGHALDMPRTHGYSEKGKRCFGLHDWEAKGRINVIGALIGKVLFAVGLFNCTIDSMVF